MANDTYRQEVTIEVEGDYKRIGLITKRSKFKSLSPELQTVMAREIAEGRGLGLLVDLTFDLICYKGEAAIYYPNDRAYPGSPPYAEADVTMAEQQRFIKEGAAQMLSRYRMLYSPCDYGFMLDLLSEQMWHYVEYVEENYTDYVTFPSREDYL